MMHCVFSLWARQLLHDDNPILTIRSGKRRSPREIEIQIYQSRQNLEVQQEYLIYELARVLCHICESECCRFNIKIDPFAALPRSSLVCQLT